LRIAAAAFALAPRALKGGSRLLRPRPLFLPTQRQQNWLLIIAFLSLGEALYLRYMAIENGTVSLACQAGLDTWLCAAFRLTIILFTYEVFGGVALVAALLNLTRPSVVLVAVALAAGAFGVVLHNADLSALAAGVLILSLARPAPASG
jgi:hypothetical protein